MVRGDRPRHGALAEALVRIEGFEVDARPHPAGVDATVVVRPASTAEATVPAPEVPAAVESRRDEPHARPRFRLFRRPDEPAEGDIPAPVQSAHIVPAPVQPAVEPARVEASTPAPAPSAEPVAAPPAALAPEPAVVTPQPQAPEQLAPMVSQPAARQPEPTEMLTADSRPGGAVTMREHITLVAYPFRSFVALNEFQDAIRGLRGVVNVKVRRFYRGTLHLGVEYEDVLPLTERMRDLEGFAWRLVSSSAQEIELMLEEQGDLVSSG